MTRPSTRSWRGFGSEHVPYRSSVRGPQDMAVSTAYGGRGVYWNDPERHQWEMLTVSYARRSGTG